MRRLFFALLLAPAAVSRAADATSNAVFLDDVLRSLHTLHASSRILPADAGATAAAVALLDQNRGYKDAQAALEPYTRDRDPLRAAVAIRFVDAAGELIDTNNALLTWVDRLGAGDATPGDGEKTYATVLEEKKNAWKSVAVSVLFAAREGMGGDGAGTAPLSDNEKRDLIRHLDALFGADLAALEGPTSPAAGITYALYAARRLRGALSGAGGS
jgi:hypothetical protein